MVVLPLADDLGQVNLLHDSELVLLDFALDAVHLVPHFVDPPLDDEGALAALVVHLVDLLELAPDPTILVVILASQQALRIGLALYLFDLLELPTQTLVNLVIRTVYRVLSDRVHLANAVEHLRVLVHLVLLLPLLLRLPLHLARLLLLHLYISLHHPRHLTIKASTEHFGPDKRAFASKREDNYFIIKSYQITC